LWSYTIPENATYTDHLEHIKAHITKSFNNEALIIDHEVLAQSTNRTDQSSFSQLQHSTLIPEQLRIYLKTTQYDSIPSWLSSHNRTCTIWSQNEPTVSGKGGGVITRTTASLPHHHQWLEQQTQQPNPTNPVTCQLPIQTDRFFTTYLSNDFDNIYMTIPYCPDAVMLHPLQASTDIRDVKQLTTNLLRQQPLQHNITLLALDNIENYIRTVTNSLGGELIKYDKSLLSLFSQREIFNSTFVQTFSINKDLFIMLPGNNVLVSIGRVVVDVSSGGSMTSSGTTIGGHTRKVTNTIIVEIELLGYNTIQLDPLIFFTIFSLIHPLADMMLWKYANSPFAPSRTYTMHDLVVGSDNTDHIDRLQRLKLLYPQFLFPTPPGISLIPNLQTDYTYTKLMISKQQYNNQLQAYEQEQEDLINAVNLLSISPPSNDNKTHVSGSINRQDSRTPAEIEAALTEQHFEREKNIVLNHVLGDHGQYSNTANHDGAMKLPRLLTNNSQKMDDSNDKLNPIDLAKKTIQNHIDGKQQQQQHNERFLGNNQSGLEDFIHGVCILPSMTSLFLQYRLHSTTFHNEHLSLMYTHLFLHPHETGV
jgi:hypothetical protein